MSPEPGRRPVMLPHDWYPEPLPENVRIGERSWLYSTFAFLHYRSRQPLGVRIGSDTGIYDGSFFDLGPTGEVEVGNYCALVGAILSTNGRIVIEDYAFIAHEVVLADDFAAAPGSGPRRTAEEPDPPATVPTRIVVGANSWIGARAILLGGARIGEGAIVGAATVVDFEVPPFAIVAGNPARIVGWTRPSHPE